MSIASEITRIKGNIDLAYEQCADKGATLPTTLNSQNLASTISSIPSGSGRVSITTGSFSFATDTMSISNFFVEHGLGDIPDCVVIRADGMKTEMDNRGGTFSSGATYVGQIQFFNNDGSVQRVSSTLNTNILCTIRYITQGTNYEMSGLVTNANYLPIELDNTKFQVMKYSNYYFRSGVTYRWSAFKFGGES